MNFETITYEKKERKAIITLKRPERMNALNMAMSKELHSAWSDFRDDPELWVAILTGTGGKAFSAGADLKDAAEDPSRASRKEPEDYVPLGGFTKDMEIWKPIIAAINGYALGGGLEIALTCDIRIAADHAEMGLPETRWSLIAGAGGTSRLPRMLPHAVAMKMLLTGQRINSHQALQWGLVTDVVPLKELMPRAHQIADTILENAPLAVQAAKKASLQGLDLPLASALAKEHDYLEEIRSSKDFLEGPRAFAQKRRARFLGR